MYLLYFISGMFIGYLLWGNRPTESDKKEENNDN